MVPSRGAGHPISNNLQEINDLEIFLKFLVGDYVLRGTAGKSISRSLIPHIDA
jgi:hypothetical protein